MVRAQLRVYYGPETPTTTAEPETDRNRVRMRLADLLPLLADADQKRRTWLGDFAEDEVSISSDLHEVLMAYRHCCRPSA